VIWLSAPAGSGKTTLIASYLTERKLKSLWYQVDEGDSDIATFFYYMRLAAKKVAPRRRTLLPLLTPEYSLGIPTFTLRYFENLYSRLKPPFIIVFDNYQLVPGDSSFHDRICQGLEIVPEGMNVIVLSRLDPPAQFARLRANDQMHTLEAERINFTLDESRRFVSLKGYKGFPANLLAQLVEITQGWAAGLVLLMESARIKGIDRGILSTFVSEQIFAYFAKEILEHADREIQEFLLKTAFLPKMTSKMVEELTGLLNAGSVLSTLNKNNYFTEKCFLEEAIFQYHPLFREFLLSRAKETFSAETLSILRTRAAILLEEAGQTESAASLLRDLSNWDGLVHLITKHAPLMIAQGRYHPLEDWLNSLPIGILENNPWLLFWMGQCRFPFDFSISRSFFEKAFKGFKNQKETAWMFRSWAALVHSIWQEGRDFSLFDHWAQVLDELRLDVKEIPSVEIGAQVASMMVAMLAARQPWHSDLEVWADQAFSLAERCSDIEVKIGTLCMVSFYRINTGQMRKASYLINSLRQLLQLGNVPPLSLLMVKYIESYFYRFMGLYEDALRTVSEGLKISRETGIHSVDQWFWNQGASSAVDIHDFKTAVDFFAKAESSFTQFPKWNQCHYHMYRTKEALFLKDVKRASFHADMALKVAAEIGTPLSHNFALINRAYVMHELGKDKEAVDHLSQAYGNATRSKNKLQLFSILLARSRFDFDQGNEASGISFLKKAFAIGSEEGIMPTSPSSNLSIFCGKALEAGIEIEYVQKMIRIRKLTPEKPHFYLENWPWPVKIFTFGGFELLMDGRPVQSERKIQKKPLSMLKAMIAFGGRGVREDQIQDALWPEADGDMANQSFATNLHRLRQLLGYEGAILRQEGKLTLNDRFCWVDTWAFEVIMEQADILLKKRKSEGAFQLIEKAIRIYKGPFLAKEIDQPWTVSMAERLRNKFLRNVEKLGQYYQESAQWEKALDCYLKGLEIDDLAEEFYSGLMTCYHRLGRKTDALAVYHRYQKILSSLPGLELSAKIEAIYRNLIRNI
jgi:two-component SAPR family response regulator